MLHLRDLLPAGKKVGIEYRCNAPAFDDDDDMLYPVDEYENVKIYNHMSDDEFNELTQEEKDSLKDIMRPDYDFSKFLK